MHRPSTQILGQPQLPVIATTAEFKKFLGREGVDPPSPMMVPGQRMKASDLFFGEGEFVLAYGVAGLQFGELVTIGAGWATTRLVAAGRGLVGVAMSANTDPTALSWFCVRGQVPARVTGGAASLPLYETATAGSASTTVVAGNQVTGAISLTAAGATVGTKTNCKTENGNTEVQVADYNMLYPGMAVSGTGIPGGATIVGIGMGGLFLGGATGVTDRTIRLSAAATANGQVTLTFAHPATFLTAALAEPVASALG